MPCPWRLNRSTQARRAKSWTRWSSSPTINRDAQLPGESCVHSDLGIEHLGDGTAFFGILRCLIELGFVRARDRRFHLEVNRSDGESGFLLFQSDGSGGVESLRSHAGVTELRRKRHGETSGVSRRDQLLRIGSWLRFKTSAEGIWRVFENAAGCRDRALAVLQPAAPMCACVSLHQNLLLSECNLRLCGLSLDQGFTGFEPNAHSIFCCAIGRLAFLS